jgi:phenylalanyl-tRNA synthetase beta chain
MIVSVDWLSDYVRMDLLPEEIAHRLTMAGLNLESVEPADGDTAIDLEVTSNRPDCLGHIGIAREIGVLTRQELSIPSAGLPEGRTPASGAVAVTIECPDLCPAYTARVLRCVKIGASPEWMQRRLRAIGVTPINNVVDATNYVLMECGQPLHAFDLGKLSGGRIIVRRARAGETLKAIDHREYPLSSDMCVIADAVRPVAIGGVMGGADTEITPQTRDILIEVANFQPLSIHHTARSLRLHSPSSYRFERRVNDQQLDWASRRCCELILASGGGEVLTGSVVAGEIPQWIPEPVRLRRARISRILGIDVPWDEALGILERLGLQRINADADSAGYVPPSWRRDLTREIDLIEEVARIHGYDRIPEDRPIPTVAGTRSTAERIDERIRSVLTAAGFSEAVTFSFITPDVRRMFSRHPDAEPLSITPSAGDSGDTLRSTLIPSLVACRGENARRGNLDVELFEIARAYLHADSSDPAGQPRRIGIVGGRSYLELRGVVEALARSIRRTAEVSVRNCGIAQFLAGRGAEVWLNDAPWGVLGELDREADGVRELKLRDAVTVAELDVQPLLDTAELVPQAQPISEFPAILRDLNFVLDEHIKWTELENVVRQAAGPQLEAVRFVEQYRGQHIPTGKKSYVLTLAYRAADRTLTGEEVDAAQSNIIAACGSQCGAELRK